MKLFGGGVVAAPVMAREAAAKAGVSALSPREDDMFGPALGQNAPKQSFASFLSGELSKLMNGEVRSKLEGEWSFPGRLDPDLACARSLSLSAAMRIQRDRNIEDYIERQRRDYLNQFKRETGLDWFPHINLTGRNAA